MVNMGNDTEIAYVVSHSSGGSITEFLCHRDAESTEKIFNREDRQKRGKFFIKPNSVVSI